jgi:hypothetical protein
MKKYDLLYFVGDSWSTAICTDNGLPRIPEVHERFYDIVAKYYNLPYKVTAEGGAGNSWIHRQIYDNLPTLKEQYKNIIVIVGFSDPTRIELFNNKWKDYHTIDDYHWEKGWYKLWLTEYCDPTWQSQEKYTQTLIKSLRSLYYTLDVDYLECFAFTTPLVVNNFLSSNKYLERTWADICGEEGRIFNPQINGYGHQNLLGNQKIAEAIINKLNQLYFNGSN